MIEKDKGFSSVFYTAKVLIFIQLHKLKFINPNMIYLVMLVNSDAIFPYLFSSKIIAVYAFV